MTKFWWPMTILMAALVSNPALAEPVPDFSLEEVDAANQLYGGDFSAEVNLTYAAPGKDKVVLVLEVFRRDQEGKLLLVVKSPSTLQGWNLMRTIPADHTFLVVVSLPYDAPGSGGADRVFWNQLLGLDNTRLRSLFLSWPERPGLRTLSLPSMGPALTKLLSLGQPHNLAQDYTLLSRATVPLGSLTTSCLTLGPRDPQAGIPPMKLWVTADGLIRKREDYSKDGQVFQTLAIPAYSSRIQGRTTNPRRLVWVDNLTGERWDFSWSRESVSPIPDLVFTQVKQELFAKDRH